PLMLSQTVQVTVARDRVGGVALARSQGATVILMDDGFQNPAIAKDASLIVIDGERALGNGKVFPAGPLRASLAPQLDRTDALIAEAKRDALILVTTEKDLARLRAGTGLPASLRDIVPFPVTLAFEDAARLRKFLSEQLFKARERKFRNSD